MRRFKRLCEPFPYKLDCKRASEAGRTLPGGSSSPAIKRQLDQFFDISKGCVVITKLHTKYPILEGTLSFFIIIRYNKVTENWYVKWFNLGEGSKSHVPCVSRQSRVFKTLLSSKFDLSYVHVRACKFPPPSAHWNCCTSPLKNSEKHFALLTPTPPKNKQTQTKKTPSNLMTWINSPFTIGLFSKTNPAINFHFKNLFGNALFYVI